MVDMAVGCTARLCTEGWATEGGTPGTAGTAVLEGMVAWEILTTQTRLPDVWKRELKVSQ
jgi:hypothetical protein